MKSWLPLSEYSTKYKVSISTLRRRIKSDEVVYCFEEGKYLLKDTPLDEHSKKMVSRPQGSVAPPPQGKEPRSNNLSEMSGVTKENTPPPGGGPFLSAAQEMLSELKKAYSIILQEKEEQVLLLRDEVADLRTLVRVLEEENLRLKKQQESESFSLDSWLSVDADR